MFAAHPPTEKGRLGSPQRKKRKKERMKYATNKAFFPDMQRFAQHIDSPRREVLPE